MVFASTIILSILLALGLFQSGAIVTEASNSPGFRLGPNIGYYICNSENPYCPMGIADYGVNGNKVYHYNSTEFVSWANFTSLKIGNGTQTLTIQQNLVDYGVAQENSIGEYWAQNVPKINELINGSFEIRFLDNIWNMSIIYAGMQGVHGNLSHHCKEHGGAPVFYYCLSNPHLTVTLPFEIEMLTTTGTLKQGNYSGDSYVQFSAFVYERGSSVGGYTYDTVAFNSTVSGNPVFKVGGSNPGGIFNDAETVVCGPGGGRSINIIAIRATFSMLYLSNRGLVSVPHAWSAGSDTAETVSGVHVKTGKQPFVAQAGQGNDDNVQLW